MNSSYNKIQKVSIRFFNDREVRAVWDEMLSKWWFSVLDAVGVLSDHGLVHMVPPAEKVPYLMKDSWAATKTPNGLTGESAQTHVVETINSEQNSRLFEKKHRPMHEERSENR